MASSNDHSIGTAESRLVCRVLQGVHFRRATQAGEALGNQVCLQTGFLVKSRCTCKPRPPLHASQASTSSAIVCLLAAVRHRSYCLIRDAFTRLDACSRTDPKFCVKLRQVDRPLLSMCLSLEQMQKLWNDEPQRSCAVCTGGHVCVRQFPLSDRDLFQPFSNIGNTTTSHQPANLQPRCFCPSSWDLRSAIVCHYTRELSSHWTLTPDVLI